MVPLRPTKNNIKKMTYTYKKSDEKRRKMSEQTKKCKPGCAIEKKKMLWRSSSGTQCVKKGSTLGKEAMEVCEKKNKSQRWERNAKRRKRGVMCVKDEFLFKIINVTNILIS